MDVWVSCSLVSAFSFDAAFLGLHHLTLEASGILICSVRYGVESRKSTKTSLQEWDKDRFWAQDRLP